MNPAARHRDTAEAAPACCSVEDSWGPLAA